MKISAIYITKNEEKVIAKSINSIKNITDEIIVVDTGSTDNTVKICQELNCEIKYLKWQNDFAYARNKAIDYANGDIIIFLDADEYFERNLTLKDREQIEYYFNLDDKIDGLAVFSQDYDSITNKKLHTSYAHKIFRNDKNIRYVNPIHEVICHSKRDLNVTIIPNFTLIHTGYTAEASIAENKIKRNLEILNTLQNKTTIQYFYIARENLSLGNEDIAKENLEIFFNREDIDALCAKNNIAYLGYVYYYIIMSHHPEEYGFDFRKKWLETCINKFPYIPEFYFLMGKLYFEKDIKKSEQYFSLCAKKNIDFEMKHSELNNYSGYEPQIYYYLSLINIFTKNQSKAVNHSIVSCLLDKTNTLYLRLFLMQLNPDKKKENIDIIKKVLKPKTAKDYENLVCCLAESGLNYEFVHFALEYNNKYEGNNIVIYYAMMLAGSYEQALELLSHNEFTNKDVVVGTILLYANSITLFEKYISLISEESREVISKVCVSDYSDFTDNQKQYLNKLIQKLFIYIDQIPYPMYKYIIENNQETKQVLTTLENLKRYDQVIKMSADMIIYNKNNNIGYDDIIEEAVKCAFYGNQFDLFFTILENKALPQLERYIRALPNSKLTKPQVKQKYNILRRLNNARS